MNTLSAKARSLFDARNFVVLTTLEPDGRPQSTVVWATVDDGDDDVVFVLPSNRRKVANLRRDPRAAVAVYDAANPYDSVQVQGTASVQDEPTGERIEALSHQYTGGPYPGFAGPDPRWTVVRVHPEKVTTSWPEP